MILPLCSANLAFERRVIDLADDARTPGVRPAEHPNGRDVAGHPGIADRPVAFAADQPGTVQGELVVLLDAGLATVGRRDDQDVDPWR